MFWLAKHAPPLIKLTRSHLLKEVEIFLNRTLPVGNYSYLLFQGAAVL